MNKKILDINSLQRFGFKKFCESHFVGDEVRLKITDESIAEWTESIYGWVIGEEVVRLGSSKGPLKNRMKSHCRWHEMRLQGICKISNPKKLEKQTIESKLWRSRAMEFGGICEAWGRKGTKIDTSIGEVNAYLAEENYLLQKFRPELNNSYRF